MFNKNWMWDENRCECFKINIAGCKIWRTIETLTSQEEFSSINDVRFFLIFGTFLTSAPYNIGVTLSSNPRPTWVRTSLMDDPELIDKTVTEITNLNCQLTNQIVTRKAWGYFGFFSEDSNSWRQKKFNFFLVFPMIICLVTA